MMRASCTASSTSAMILTFEGSISFTWATRSFSRVKRSHHVTSACTAPHLPCPIVFVSTERFWRPQAQRAHRAGNGAAPHREVHRAPRIMTLPCVPGSSGGVSASVGSVISHHHMLWLVLLVCSVVADTSGTLPPPSNRLRGPFASFDPHPTIRVVRCRPLWCMGGGG